MKAMENIKIYKIQLALKEVIARETLYGTMYQAVHNTKPQNSNKVDECIWSIWFPGA